MFFRKKEIPTSLMTNANPLYQIEQKKLNNFMTYLKDVCDYDEITMHTYYKPFENYNLKLLDDALNSIMTFKFSYYEKDYYNQLKATILNCYSPLRILQMTRIYESHQEDDYLIVSAYFDRNDNYHITIPLDLNYLGMIHVKSIWRNIDRMNFHSYKIYAEFKEKESNASNASYAKELFYFESVLEIDMEVQHYCPFLDPKKKDRQNIQSRNRKAQVIMRYYPEDSLYDQDYMIDTKLMLNGTVIKSELRQEDSYDLSAELFVDKFIFPLAESYEDFKEWDFYPEITPEFMAVDYTDFWSLKLMMNI